MKDIMIDCETMSEKPNGAIVSIGAVQFDMGTGEIGKKFYKNIDLQSCINYGLTLSAGTIMWWMSKDKEAQNSLLKDCFDLQDALEYFEDWLISCQADKCRIWAN